MSKSQKIILYIGAILIGLSLVLLLVNTILVKKDSANNQQVTPDTNLFSLFERSSPNKDSQTPNVDDQPQIGGEDVLGQTVFGGQKTLFQVSERPVTNFIPVEKDVVEIVFGQDTKTPQVKNKKQGVRYMGPDGLVYEKYDNETESRISNTVSPRLGEGFVYKNNVVFRYSREDMQTIETFLGNISTKESSLGEVAGSYLSKNIRSFALNETNGIYAFLSTDESRNSAQIFTGSMEKAQTKLITKTTFTDWLLDWGSGSVLNLTTRPSAEVVGYFYTLNIQTGLLGKVFSGLGLTTKSLGFDTGTIISYLDSGSYKTELYSNNKLTYLPFKTIADKCVAISKTSIVCAVPGAGYPQLDLWYKGEFNYKDSLVLYNIQNGSQKVIYDGSPEVLDVDIIKSSTDGSYVFFRNKINGFVYKLKTN